VLLSCRRRPAVLTPPPDNIERYVQYNNVFTGLA
jgi:hypothetical protein